MEQNALPLQNPVPAFDYTLSHTFQFSCHTPIILTFLLSSDHLKLAPTSGLSHLLFPLSSILSFRPWLKGHSFLICLGILYSITRIYFLCSSYHYWILSLSLSLYPSSFPPSLPSSFPPSLLSFLPLLYFFFNIRVMSTSWSHRAVQPILG